RQTRPGRWQRFVSSACQESPKASSSHQKVSRMPNCSVHGSPTAVHVLKLTTGFLGYAPAPKMLFRVMLFTRSVTLNASTRPSALTSPLMRKARLTRRFNVKKLLPTPAFLGMNSTARTSKFGAATAPLARGRLVVPCRFGTPDGRVNGRAEEYWSMLLTWNPWPMRSHAVVAADIGVFTVPLMTRR